MVFFMEIFFFFEFFCDDYTKTNIILKLVTRSFLNFIINYLLKKFFKILKYQYNKIKMNNSSLLEITFLLNDEKNTNQKLKELVDFLNDHHYSSTDSSKIFNNNSLYTALIQLGKILAYLPNQIDYSLFAVRNFQKFISNGLLTLYEFKHELNFKIEHDAENAEKAVLLNEKRILTLSYLLFIAAKLVFYSDEFAEQFIEGNGLKIHLLFLSNNTFIKDNHLTLINNLSGTYNLFNQIYLNILNMSIKSKNQKLWDDLSSSDILLKAAGLMKNTTNSFLAYLILLHTNAIDQVEKLNEKDMLKDWLLNIVAQCGNDFKTKNFIRFKYKVGLNDESIECESHLVQCDTYLYLSVGFLLNCLSKLCVDNQLRRTVYFKMENALKEIFLNGNFIEVFFGQDLLAKLCLSEEVCRAIVNNIILYKILTKLFVVIDIKESKENMNSKMKMVYGEMKTLAKAIKLSITIANSK
jgi:hypothetical protein